MGGHSGDPATVVFFPHPAEELVIHELNEKGRHLLAYPVNTLWLHPMWIRREMAVSEYVADCT